MQATSSTGALVPIPGCYIDVPIYGRKIEMKVLPDISDSKSAAYTDEPIIGRSFPLKTFSHGENRSISMTVHFIVCTRADITRNLEDLRMLESLVYPGESGSITPYLPPPIANIKCGSLLSTQAPLCVILKSYSVKFPTEVAWDQDEFTPYKFDVDLTWEVVYDSGELPGQGRIMRIGF